MDLSFFGRGLVIGFAIAAPVGPIGVLCIRRTLAEGQRVGLITGLGAASADAFYGGVAAFGLTFISGVLVGQRAWLRLIGGAFLCCLGVVTFLKKPSDRAANVKGSSLGLAFLSTLFLTLTNPLTILSFAAVFAGFGLASSGGMYGSATLLVVGVFTGSALWWLFLSSVVARLRTRFSPGMMNAVNKLSGSIIAAFGVIALASLNA